MIRQMHSALTLALAFVSTACSDTGQEYVTIPFRAVGTEPTGQLETASGELVNVTRADLAFGAFYLCAGNTAGDLCETARLEWLDSAVIDTTSEEEMTLGSLTGVTGAVNSWMYDLSLSSQLSRSEPYVLAAAEELGGVSFVLEGFVTLNGVEVSFSASVPVQQNETTEFGVPVIRKGSEERFSHEITGEESGLTLHFDPAAWVRRLDFAGIVEDEVCEPGGPAVVCAGQIEATCDEDGTTISRRDCGDEQEACVSGGGCTDSIVLEEGTNGYRSLAIALATTGRPSFEWKN